MNKKSIQTIYQLHANICKTFTSPTRLMIIEELRSGEKTVSEIAETLNIRQANLSQHLAVLREKGIVVCQRRAQNAYYGISNPKILKACNLMREVLLEQIEQNSSLLIENHA